MTKYIIFEGDKALGYADDPESAFESALVAAAYPESVRVVACTKPFPIRKAPKQMYYRYTIRCACCSDGSWTSYPLAPEDITLCKTPAPTTNVQGVVTLYLDEFNPERACRSAERYMAGVDEHQQVLNRVMQWMERYKVPTYIRADGARCYSVRRALYKDFAEAFRDTTFKHWREESVGHYTHYHYRGANKIIITVVDDGLPMWYEED